MSGSAGVLTFTAKGTFANVDNITATGSGTDAIAKVTLAQTETYAASNVLTVSYTKNDGSTASEDVSLVDSDFYADTDSTISFAASGISIDIRNYQDRTAKEIAYQISELYGSNSDTTGVLNVLNSDSNELSFQSGATSSSYIDVKTLNVMTGSTGIYEGSSEEMMAVGDYVTDTLANLDSDSADEDWQAAFTALASAIDDAIDYISTERAVYGSQINRLSFMTTNLQANSTNLQSSRSSIIDTDFAAETAALTKGQIMQQAATAMLAQANQMPNVILSLLK
jgi:flagellin